MRTYSAYLTIIAVLQIGVFTSVCTTPQFSQTAANKPQDRLEDAGPKGNPCGIPTDEQPDNGQPYTTFEYVKKSIVFPVCLRGPRGVQMPANFIVDTGSSSLVDIDVARMLQLPQTRTTTLVAPGGNVTGAPVFRGELKVRGYEVLITEMAARDFAPYSKAHQLQIDGILGVDVLKERILGVEYLTRRIEFRKTHLENIEPLTLVATIPFRIEKGLPLVRCRFPNNIQIDLIVDTGHMYDVQVYSDVSKQLELPPATSTKKLGGAAETHEVTFHPIPHIYLGEYRIDNVAIDVHPLVTSNAFTTTFKPGLLGQGILERYTIEMDFIGSKLRLYQRSKQN